jgi:hypothetical protein
MSSRACSAALCWLVCVLTSSAAAQCVTREGNAASSQGIYPQHGRFGCPHAIALAFHGGRVFPHGSFSGRVGIGSAVSATFSYTLRPSISFGVQAERFIFPGK